MKHRDKKSALMGNLLMIIVISLSLFSCAGKMVVPNTGVYRQINNSFQLVNDTQEINLKVNRLPMEDYVYQYEDVLKASLIQSKIFGMYQPNATWKIKYRINSIQVPLLGGDTEIVIDYEIWNNQNKVDTTTITSKGRAGFKDSILGQTRGLLAIKRAFEDNIKKFIMHLNQKFN